MPIPLADNELLFKYRRKGALIDTNLVILFVVGSYNPERISSFNRTRKFERSDFDLVLRIAQWFEKRVTTPNILTEVDNLVRQLPEAEHVSAATTMRSIFSALFERNIASSTATSSVHYPKFGLTDAVSIAVAYEDWLVITDDFPLAGMLTRLGRAVVNFNHLRSLHS